MKLEIASEYHIQVPVTWPWRCLPYATFKNESDLDLQDQNHAKNVIFKIKIRSLKYVILKIKIVPMSVYRYSTSNCF